MKDGAAANCGWPEWLVRLQELEGNAASWLDRITSRVIDRAFIKPGETVADLGAGTGLLTKKAAAAAGSRGRVFAVDSSPECLSLLREDRAIMELGNVLTVTGRLEGLPLDSGIIDAVVCRSAMTYSDDLSKAVAEIRRVLRPGGRFSVFEPLAGEMEWTDPIAAGERFIEIERLIREGRSALSRDRSLFRGAFSAGGLAGFDSLVVHFDLGFAGRGADELAREYLYDLPGDLSAIEVLRRAGVSDERSLEAAREYAVAAASGALKGRLPGIFIWGARER